jgi:hypothetical protein
MAWTRIYTPPENGRRQHSLWLDESVVEGVRVVRDYTEYVADDLPTAICRQLLDGETLRIRLATNGGVRWMTDDQAAEANR